MSDDPRDLLSAYLDGELDGAERDAVEAYLDGSGDARAELEALAAVRTSLREMGPVEPPAGFLEGLVEAGAADTASVVTPLRAISSPPAADARRDARRDALGDPELDPRLDDEDVPAPFQPASGSRARRGRDARERRGPSFGRVAAAIGAAAAAVVVLLGVTPISDSVVPPVQAFAARHDEMMAAPPLPGPDGSTSPTTQVTSTTGPAATSSLPIETTTTTTAPASAEAKAMAFAPMAPADLATMEAPYTAPPSIGGALSRMAAYHSVPGHDDGGGVLHLMYTDGTAVISVYEQEGAVRWDALPAGTSMTVGGDPAWAMRSGTDEVVVLARGPIVYTIVATAPHDLMMSAATELPRPADASMPERAQAACRTMVVRFGFGD